MGMVEYGEHEDYVFLGRDILSWRDYSEANANKSTRKCADDRDAINGQRTLIAIGDTLETIAKALLEYETLDGSQIKEIMTTAPPA